MLLKKDNMLILGFPMWNGQMWENVGKESYGLGTFY